MRPEAQDESGISLIRGRKYPLSHCWCNRHSGADRKATLGGSTRMFSIVVESQFAVRLICGNVGDNHMTSRYRTPMTISLGSVFPFL